MSLLILPRSTRCQKSCGLQTPFHGSITTGQGLYTSEVTDCSFLKIGTRPVGSSGEETQDGDVFTKLQHCFTYHTVYSLEKLMKVLRDTDTLRVVSFDNDFFDLWVFSCLFVVLFVSDLFVHVRGRRPLRDSPYSLPSVGLSVDGNPESYHRTLGSVLGLRFCSLLK